MPNDGGSGSSNAVSVDAWRLHVQYLDDFLERVKPH